MYTIGEISKIVNISTDTLRYYDEIGLLKPVRIDSNSKYRYYSDIQVEDILLIMELKQYGFTLEEIKNLLTCKVSKDIKTAFQAKLDEFGDELSNIKNIMEILQKRINELERENGNMLAQKSVLIVDDVFLVRLLIRNILEKFGYRIAGEAANGLEACEKYIELKPDLVIMDITMPIMDGIYATQKIREKHKDAKILMCSVMSQAVIAIESLKAGAIDFICKPFTEIRLLEGIEKALSTESNYDVQYLSDLYSQIENGNFGGLDKHKPLIQKGIDELMNLISEKVEIIDFNRFNKEQRFPDYLSSPGHWNSLRESDVGIPVLNEVAAFFQEFLIKSSLYLQNKTGFNYSLKLLSVQQTLNYDTYNIIDESVYVGIINVKGKNLPVAIISLQDINASIFYDAVDCIYNGLQPIISDDTSLSKLSGREYLSIYDSVFAQVNAMIELISPDNTKNLISVNIPHEIAKTDEFRNNILHWKLNRL